MILRSLFYKHNTDKKALVVQIQWKLTHHHLVTYGLYCYVFTKISQGWTNSNCIGNWTYICNATCFLRYFDKESRLGFLTRNATGFTSLKMPRYFFWKLFTFKLITISLPGLSNTKSFPVDVIKIMRLFEAKAIHPVALVLTRNPAL